MKRYVVGIRCPGESEVAAKGKVVSSGWFPSMATMAAVLSEDNRALLRIIRDARSKALTELAALSGRQAPVTHAADDGGLWAGGTQTQCARN